jgi:outer membrane beta-barrel protein
MKFFRKIALLKKAYICLGILSFAVFSEEVKPKDDIETIYVVQPHRQLSNRLETSLQIAQQVNGIFINQTGGMLALIYHIRENLSVEANGGWFFLRENSLRATQIKLNTLHTGELVEYYRTPWLVSSNFNWSIINGKLLFHTLSLGQFNIYLTLGAGVNGLELKNATTQDEPIDLVNPVQFTTNFGGGIRIYFNDYIGIKLEFRDYVMPLIVRKSDFPSGVVDQSSFDVSHLILAQLGLNIVFF